jgi:nitrogen-specific signal transduction histidine kinase
MKLRQSIVDWIFVKTLSKWQIKILLLLVGLFIVISAVIFTNIIVDELVAREIKSMNLYTELYKKWADPNSNVEEFDLLIKQIVPMITFPIIITDENDEPLEPFEDYTLNIDIDTSLSSKEQKAILMDMLDDMSSNYKPIVVEDEGVVLSKFYFTHSALIDRLQLFPLIEIVVIATFIIFGYIAFSNIRKSEESKVWVGMAKEAAHQLGTPLSSLLAWIEIMKYNKDNPKAISETLSEMENDVNRLNMIATRFSKIGSIPELTRQNLNEQIEKVSLYFEKRLPHLGRKVKIVRDFDKEYFADINPELFAWVIENLLKNAAEALDIDEGIVAFSIKETSKNKIIISVKDNGKGMNSSQRRQVFLPGFTTKKRGWGLGLNLSKRIVEDYHKGRIYIKDTAPGKGTVFNIELPVKS